MSNETSIFKGTISRADTFARNVLPKIENDIRGAVTRLQQELARLTSTAEKGTTFRGRGVTEEFSPEEIAAMAPTQFAELVALKESIETIFKQHEITVTRQPAPGPIGAAVLIEPLSVQSGDEPPLRADEITATLPPPAKKGKDAPLDSLS